MSNLIAKKIFASAVAASTVLGSFGSLALVAKASPHGAGSVIQAAGDPTVWFITNDGMRRPFTSGGALQSYGFLSFSQVVTANTDDLALPVGAFIPPADGTIFCATETKGNDVKGECSVITGGQKASVTSAAVFNGQGYSFSNAYYGDSSFLTKTSNIDNAAGAHLMGTLINKAGTVYLVGPSGGLLGIPDIATFNSWGYSFAKVVAGNAADTGSQTGVMASRVPGQLSPTGLVTPPTTGSVTIAAASNNPASATVPVGSTNVAFLKFTISNNASSAATVSGITVNRSGAGNTSDFDNVYLYNGDERLTSGRTINNSTNQAVFNGLNLTVPANGSLTLTVLADMSTTAGAGNVHILSVSNMTLVSGTASGAASGNAMTIATASSGSVTVAANGGTLQNPKVGQTNFKIAQFQVTAGSEEDLTLKRIALFNGGGISKQYLSNFKLRQNGVDVATATSIDSKDKITFTLNFALDKGNSRTFEVYADIAGSAKPNDTIKLYLEESSDLFAMGRTFGFGARVTRTLYDNSPSDASNASLTTVEGGKMTVSFSGPAGMDIARDGRDVEIFNFTIAAQNNIEVRQLGLDFDNGGSGTADFVNASNVPHFTDVKIWDTTNNTVVWGPRDFSGIDGGAGDTTQSITFPEDVVLNAGQSKAYKVTMDVANLSTIDDGEKIRATLDISDFDSQVKNLDNNTFLATSEIVPTADLAGNQMTIKVAGLAISLAGTPTSSSFVKGSTGIPAVGLNFQTGTAKDIKVNSVTLTGLMDSNADNTGAVGVEGGVNVSDSVISVELYDGATKIGNTESPAVTTGLVSFTNLNWTIAKGTTKTLVVKFNSNSSLTANDIVKFGIAASGVSANDADGNSIVPTGLPVNQSTTMTTGTNVTLTGAGTVTVTNAPEETDVTDSHIVIAGGAATTLAKFKFNAASEEMQLTKLRLSVPTAQTDEVLNLWLFSGGVAIAGPVTPTGAGLADFNSISGFIIPKDGNRVLEVKADLNTISAGGDSGADILVTMEGDAAENFEVRGTGTSNTLIVSHTGGDLAASGTMRYYKTKPTVNKVATASTITTGVEQEFYKFTVGADAAEDVALRQIKFSVVITDVNADNTLTVDNFKIFRGNTDLSNSALIQAADGTLLEAASLAEGSNTVVVTFGSTGLNGEEVIPKGTTNTYSLRGTPTGFTDGSDDDSVSAELSRDAATQTTGHVYIEDTDATASEVVLQLSNGAAANSAANFIWSDNSGGVNGSVAHSPAVADGSANPDTGLASHSADWINGYLVRNFPLGSSLATF
jgi:hypothetical protein